HGEVWTFSCQPPVHGPRGRHPASARTTGTRRLDGLRTGAAASAPARRLLAPARRAPAGFPDRP
ncbi:hypothetical protein, partial [Streptomyces sp. GSL17-113]|uniref:hypothetical protein n=1 Tax=Streptomyces sp. GSL17-113 TaxID=3115365 RepID=UPI002E786688